MDKNIPVRFVSGTKAQVLEHKDDIQNGSIIFVSDTAELIVKLDTDDEEDNME